MKTKFSTYFWAALAAMVTLLSSSAAYAEVTAAQAEQNKWLGLGAALGIGIAAFGCGLGQGRAAGAALEGIARNPGASDKLFTPMIIGLALIESLAIYALLISLLLLFTKM
jgi:F-type H+-transporting ATPase subunit c